ncbi:MAG: magnesium chelatase domain-containing protein, partial [Chloroflexota bacterium]
MMARVFSCAVGGLDGEVVTVEVDISPGLPVFNIVGLPDAAVQEAKERVRAAIRNSGCLFPPRRITVNLAPADLKKAGPAYDLPIAIGLLLSSEQVAYDGSKAIFLGELSLDGTLRHTPGVLSMAALARERGFGTVFLPTVNAQEAALVDGLEIVPVDSLTALVAHLRGEAPLVPYHPDGGPAVAEPSAAMDLSQVRGQEHVRRA